METIAEAPVAARAAPRAAAPSTPSSSGRAGPAAAGPAGEFLTFRLGDEEYGIDILRVQEIRSYEPPTRIANAPPFVKGVVNLRGVIVPIIELNGFTVVVVLNVRGRVVGTVVDSVSDVMELTREQIKPAPALASTIDAGFITGIGTVRHSGGGDGAPVNDSERMLILIDIEALMSSADMGLIEAV